MVKKLIKHEIASSARHFVPVFIMGLVGAGIFTSLMVSSFKVEYSDMVEIAIGLGIVLLIGLVIASIVLMVIGELYVTYKSMYSVTGYRQFTYPITSQQRIAVKVITTLFWTIVTSLYVMVMVGISLFITAMFSTDFSNLMNIVIDGLGDVLRNIDYAFATSLIVSGIGDTILSVFIILLAGAFANSSRIRKNRSVVALVAFLIINFVLSTISSIVLNLIFQANNVSFLGIIMAGDGSLGHLGIYLGTLIKMIYCVGCYFAIVWLWENKLEILN